MKRIHRQSLRFAILGLLFAGCFAVAPLGPSGCSFAPQPTLSASASDQIILRAEQTAQAARLTFKTFVTLERENTALLKQVSPAIHDYSNVIRRNGLNWVDSLRQATDTFEGARTPQNQANLNTWLTTVTNAISQSNQYIAQAKTKIAP
jgi:hypothetical protein